MRTGTFLCWLFGHKFIAKSESPSPYGEEFMRVQTTVTNWCVRCGKSKGGSE